MLPTVNADSMKIVNYSAEVTGRIDGVAAMPNLVPDADGRTILINASTSILSVTRALLAAFTARVQFKELEYRIVFGKGKGVDRGFEGIVAEISQSARTSLPDRVTQNPDYRALFPNGTDEFTTPTIRDDEEAATDLRTRLTGSNLREKDTFIGQLDAVIPVIRPAAQAVRAGELHINELAQHEMNARKAVIDTLWEQRRLVEIALGRGGKGLARFIFFDFRKSNGSDEPAAPEPTTPPTP